MREKDAEITVVPGMLVYVRDDLASWIEGTVICVTDKECSVIMQNTQEKKQFPVDEVLPRSDQHLSEMQSLTDLSPINQASVLCCLAERFNEGLIYTNAGSTVVAVNPFQPAGDIYNQETIMKYHTNSENDPHIYRIGSEAYTSLCRGLGQGNQCIIVSGESGSGKTVSAKHLLKFMTVVSSSSHDMHSKRASGMSKSVEQRILDSNPILEAFGNAVTQRNNNSSRFGKYIQLQFSRGGQMLGGEIQTYLLEKTRVVHQSSGEANFHIFYQIMENVQKCRDSPIGSLVGDTRVDAFQVLPSQKAMTSNRDISETLQAMTRIGISEQIQGEITKVLVAVLFLCNVEITPLEEDLCELLQETEDRYLDTGFFELEVSQTSLQQAADLLGIEMSNIEQVLLYRNIQSGGQKRRSMFVKPVPQREAYSRRDCLATLLYSRLFEWLVSFINKQICGTTYDHTIGLLDIYGFEAFETNSLEQLCINYANEKLQQHYISHFLKDIQREYEDECIQWRHLSYCDNQSCLDILDSQSSVFGLLNEDVQLNRQTNTELLCERILELSKQADSYVKRPRNFMKDPGFTICHYAGEVTYKGEDLTTKNRDNIPQDLVGMLQASSNSFIVKLFENFQTDSGNSKRKKTVLSKFKASLDYLMSSIKASDVHYIRCIKPNTGSLPGVFDSSYVMSQLTAGGIIETVKISCLGYPVRMPYSLFLQRYGLMMRNCSSRPPATETDNTLDDTDSVYDPLEALYRRQLDMTPKDSPRRRFTPKKRLRRRAGLSSADHTRRCSAAVLVLQFGRCEGLTQQFGRTKLFLHQHQIDSLEQTRYNIIDQKARLIQRAWRRYRQRQERERQRCRDIAAATIQKTWRKYLRCKHSQAVILIQKTFRMYKAKVQFRKLQQAKSKQRKRRSSEISWKPILDCKRTSPGTGRSGRRGQRSSNSGRSDASGSRSNESCSGSETCSLSGRCSPVDNCHKDSKAQFTTSTPRIENRISKSRNSDILTSQESHEKKAKSDKMKKNPKGRPDMSKYSPVKLRKLCSRTTKRSSSEVTKEGQGHEGDDEGASPSKKRKMIKSDEKLTDVLNLGNGILTRRGLPKVPIRFHTRASVLKYAHYQHQKELPTGLMDCLPLENQENYPLD